MFGEANDIDCVIKQELVPAMIEGRKTVEMRLYRDKWMNVMRGTLLRVNKEYIFLVKAVRYWNDFESALHNYSISKVLPDITSIEEGVKFYEKIYGSEDLHLQCVVAIEVKYICQVNRHSQCR